MKKLIKTLPLLILFASCTKETSVGCDCERYHIKLRETPNCVKMDTLNVEAFKGDCALDNTYEGGLKEFEIVMCW